MPPPNQYFAYRELLTSHFLDLRMGCGEVRRKRAAALAPVCDLIRFGDEHPAPIHVDGKLLFDSEKKEFVTPVEQCTWPADIDDFELFHINCDFASWCLVRIGDGRFSDAQAQGFGYLYQHFPQVRGYWGDDEETKAAWKRAAIGQLPSPRRAQVR
ncbi:MAG: hypothetical protein RID07_11315, partial [Lacipirellulaceae bacterium]